MSKLKDPRLWASIAAALVAVVIGLNRGIAAHRSEVLSQGDWAQTDSERFQGITYGYLITPVMLSVGSSILLTWIFIPDPTAKATESDRDVIARVARKRLAGSALSEAEMMHWSAVLDEMEDSKQ